MAKNHNTLPVGTWMPDVSDLLPCVVDNNQDQSLAAWDGIPLTVLEHFNWTPAESVAICRRKAKIKFGCADRSSFFHSDDDGVINVMTKNIDHKISHLF